MRLLRWASVAGLFIALAALVGCDEDCGDSVYPTQADLGPDGQFVTHTGPVRTYSDTDMIPPLDPASYGVHIVEDVHVGDGRFAQTTRLMTVRFTASDDGGKTLGGGEVTFLYPPAELDGRQLISAGRVPDSFANGLAGMRVGGERVFTDSAEQGTWRAFMTKGSMRDVFSLPNSGRLTYRVSLLAVCRPTVCLRKEYSIPANTTTKLHIRSCD